MEEALEQHVRGDYLLVSPPPLRRELVALAQECQGQANPHVLTASVSLMIARCTAVSLTHVGPATFYLGKKQVSERE
jgi:hypothetical protein